MPFRAKRSLSAEFKILRTFFYLSSQLCLARRKEAHIYQSEAICISHYKDKVDPVYWYLLVSLFTPSLSSVSVFSSFDTLPLPVSLFFLFLISLHHSASYLNKNLKITRKKEKRINKR